MSINKSFVAELFNVSRSAVTQSTHNKSLEQDIQKRIMHYIMPKTMDRALENDTVEAIQLKRAAYLYKKAEKLFNKRKQLDAAKVSGRPFAETSLEEFKQLIDQVLSLLSLSLEHVIDDEECTKESPNEAAFVVRSKLIAFYMRRFVSQALGFFSKRWNSEKLFDMHNLLSSIFGTKQAST